MQSKLSSFYEAMLNTIIGYIISLTAQLFVFPIYGHSFSVWQNVQIGVIFMALSLARSYLLRRFFNAYIVTAARKLGRAK
tara:strand:- start:19746 stop:19985 length:240 start_codon:yes stop_codon:yes gene_type:complete